MNRERSEQKKFFCTPPLLQMWGYKQANVSFEYTEICCVVVVLKTRHEPIVLRISKRDNFTFQQWQLKLEGCIVLNGRNAVFARIGPLYATVSLAPPESWTQTLSRSLPNFLQGSLGDTDRQTDRPRYSVVHNRRHIYLRIKGKERKIYIAPFVYYVYAKAIGYGSQFYLQIHHACLSSVSVH